MIYTIKYKTPSIEYHLEHFFFTKKDASQYLSEVLINYKKDAPRGEKRRNHWSGKDRIICQKGGDEITYSIS